MPGTAPTYLQSLTDQERIALLRKTLLETAGVVVAAARLLGISKPLLWYNLRKYGLDDVPANIREQMKKRYRLPPLPKMSA